MAFASLTASCSAGWPTYTLTSNFRQIWQWKSHLQWKILNWQWMQNPNMRQMQWHLGISVFLWCFLQIFKHFCDLFPDWQWSMQVAFPWHNFVFEAWEEISWRRGCFILNFLERFPLTSTFSLSKLWFQGLLFPVLFDMYLFYCTEVQLMSWQSLLCCTEALAPLLLKQYYQQKLYGCYAGWLGTSGSYLHRQSSLHQGPRSLVRGGQHAQRLPSQEQPRLLNKQQQEGNMHKY